MSELSKLLSSALLLGAGFFGASLFGPPELAQRLVRHWSAPRVDMSQGLQPLAPGELLASRKLPTEPAPFTPPQALRHTVAKQPAAPPSVQTTTWTTPDFSSAQSGAAPESPAPSETVGPSADFNAWLGSAGDWLRGQEPTAPNETAPVQSNAVTHAGGPVEWLPPRSPQNPPAVEEPLSGPSLFAAEAPAVGRSTPPLSFDAWERPTVSALGPPPKASWPSPSRGADFRPVAREQSGGFDTHVVTDGDTLPMIAERYLGDAARAAELFELNRELLESPELLPIGVVLRLPREPRRPAPTAGATRFEAPGPTPFSTVSVDTGLGFASPREAASARFSEPGLVPVGGRDDAPPRDPYARFERELSW